MSAISILSAQLKDNFRFLSLSVVHTPASAACTHMDREMTKAKFSSLEALEVEAQLLYSLTAVDWIEYASSFYCCQIFQ